MKTNYMYVHFHLAGLWSEIGNKKKSFSKQSIFHRCTPMRYWTTDLINTYWSWFCFVLIPFVVRIYLKVFFQSRFFMKSKTNCVNKQKVILTINYVLVQPLNKNGATDSWNKQPSTHVVTEHTKNELGKNAHLWKSTLVVQVFSKWKWKTCSP